MKIEKDLKGIHPRIVHGVYGVKSKPFSKKFKSQEHMEKWIDSDEFNHEIHSIEKDYTKLKEDTEQLHELSKATLKSYKKQATIQKDSNPYSDTATKRRAGIRVASDKIGFARHPYKTIRIRATESEDISNLIYTAIDSKPSEFQDSFVDILKSKISDRVDEYKNYIAGSLVNETENVESEDNEQLHELSKATLKSYIYKAVDGKEKSLSNQTMQLGKIKAGQDEVDRLTNRHGNSYTKKDQLNKILGSDYESEEKVRNTAINRITGIKRATNKLTKESD